MNNKIKYIIQSFFLLILLTGCTIKADIVVNYDGSVVESVKVLSYNDLFGKNNENLKHVVDTKINQNKTILEYKNYSYDYEYGKELSGAKVYKNYNSICNYFGNSAFNQYVYKYMECTENDYYYEIKNATEYIPYCIECGDWPALDDVELRISLPASAEEQNADEVDKTTYIWKYDKDTRNKNFYLKINKNSLKESEEKYNKTKKIKKAGKRIIIIAIIVIVIFGIFTIYKLLKKKYNENSFDYE